MLRPRIWVNRFVTSSDSYYGSDCIKALTSLRNANTLIIVSRSVRKEEHFENLLKYIKADDCRVMPSPFHGEPTRGEVFDALGHVEEFQPDAIIAIGGGSVLDGAKLIAYFYEKGDVSEELYSRIQPPDALKRIAFYAIPTTCGTGSEVSSSAVLDVGGRKVPVVTHSFLPKAYFLDPHFLTSLPANVKIETAVDAFTHAVEGYTSKLDNPLMDIFAVNSLRLIRENLLDSIDSRENTDLLLDLQMASMFAGFVQNHCLVGLCHAISHAVSRYNPGHGYLNMCFIDSVIKFNKSDGETRARYERLFNLAGFSDLDEVRDFLKTVRTIHKKKISNLIGVDDLLSDDVVDEIINDKLTRVNPIIPEPDDVRRIIGESFGT